MFLAYVVAYVDRANVAVAKLTMAKDLKFDDAVFGLGSGIFFIGYFLLEIWPRPASSRVSSCT